ncbi:hypothetical protein G6672_02600 [Polynucleobacter paneuropaeus]|nr:hypothetical protein [Polynucleobacter paneuropaeus]
MKLAQIRQRTAHNPHAIATQKTATRTWLASKAAEYPIALTLTLKQTITLHTQNGTYKRAITRADCDVIAKHFINKLNVQVYGNAAKRSNKSLKYIVVVEDGFGTKNLHLHLAIGAIPKHVKFNQIDALVKEAKTRVEEIDVQHKVNVANSGWFEYITKEVSKHNTDNVLWQLA